MEGLAIRPAREAEVAACRMLLAKDLIAGTKPEFLIALQDREPRFAAAAAYLPAADSIAGVRIRVLRPLRRQGIGSMLLRAIEDAAKRRGNARLHAAIRDCGGPEPDEAKAFFAAREFKPRFELTTVEAEAAAMADYYRGLCARLRASGRVPSTARIVPLSQASRAEAMRLYERIVHAEAGRPRLSFLEKSRYDDCPVALDSGKVVGMLLWEIHEDHGTIPARAVAPGYEGSWVNPLLLERATEQSFERGVPRIRFEIPQGNRDTGKLAARYGARVVSTLRQFVRDLAE